MKSNFLSVEADIADVQTALERTGKSLKSIRRQVLGVAARGTAKAVKQSIALTGKGKNSVLKKAYSYHVKKDGSAANVYPKNYGEAKNKNWVVGLSVIQNYGADVHAKRGRYLVFLTKDGWRKMKSVHVPARHFIEAGERYAESDNYTQALEAIIAKELQKAGW